MTERILKIRGRAHLNGNGNNKNMTSYDHNDQTIDHMIKYETNFKWSNH